MIALLLSVLLALGPNAQAVHQVNGYRDDVHAPALEMDRYMNRWAYRWSIHMARQGSQEDPPASWFFAMMHHYPRWRGAADCVAGYEGLDLSPRHWIRLMWHHPAHRRIMSFPSYDHIGVGIYYDEDGASWITLLFRY